MRGEAGTCLVPYSPPQARGKVGKDPGSAARSCSGPQFLAGFLPLQIQVSLTRQKNQREERMSQSAASRWLLPSSCILPAPSQPHGQAAPCHTPSLPLGAKHWLRSSSSFLCTWQREQSFPRCTNTPPSLNGDNTQTAERFLSAQHQAETSPSTPNRSILRWAGRGTGRSLVGTHGARVTLGIPPLTSGRCLQGDRFGLGSWLCSGLIPDLPSIAKQDPFF